ncbi:CarboxypepD_reg-like domain-containing protein [bacterium A37T11]|nr:CarboxypepD_reg-like domain-containing protein [bacterium A37T11]
MNAQTKVSGTVHDGTTQKPLAYVNITVYKSTIGTTTDKEGHFELTLPDSSGTLYFSLVGYKLLSKSWTGHSAVLKVNLENALETLQEVQVNSGKSKYRNKGNPAVDLIREVIAHKDENRFSAVAQASYKEYTKLHFAISNVPNFFKNNFMLKKYKFYFDNVDTTMQKGRSFLPVYLEEQVNQQYRTRHPSSSKTIIEANKKVEFDKRYVQNDNLTTFFKFLYRDLDVYDNDLIILNKPFLSPLSPSSPIFYRFYITDTLTLAGGQRVVNLRFEPRNTTDRLFSGTLHVSLDGRYALQFAQLEVHKQANLNWVDSLNTTFEFQLDSSGKYLPSKYDLRSNFSIANSNKGAFGQRTIVFTHMNIHDPVPDRVFAGQQLVRLDSTVRPESYWQLNRPVALKTTEAKAYANTDSLNHMRSFNRLLEWSTFLLTSYKRVGDIELGPLEYVYSRNPIEGNRFRLGGRTTPELSRKFYGDGYVAYGFRDERLKYLARGAYTLNGKPIGQYPANYLQASVQHEINTPGDVLQFTNGDSFFGSFRRGDNDRWLDYKQYKLEHFVEFGNHVRLHTSLNSLSQGGTWRLPFVRSGPVSDTVGPVKATEIGMEWRWAPGEQFYQRNLNREAIANGRPVFSLQYRLGLKGLLDGQYNYSNLELTIFKKMFFSQLGTANIYLTGGKVWGTLPFPLLYIPNANHSYLVSSNSFSLMNDLEFVSDRYVNFSIKQNFGGFFLNKIPLIKKLKLRETVQFKLLYGGLSDRNRPANNLGLLNFPLDKDGKNGTFTLESKPYMEVGFGLENIFSFLKVEYVKRLTYLNHQNIPGGGFNFGLDIGF